MPRRTRREWLDAKVTDIQEFEGTEVSISFSPSNGVGNSLTLPRESFYKLEGFHRSRQNLSDYTNFDRGGISTGTRVCIFYDGQPEQITFIRPLSLL